MSVDNLFSIRDIQRENSYLGKGMAWPPQEDPVTGDFKRAEQEESVTVCIRHLLHTYVGEYPVLRAFGSRLQDILFSIGTGAVLESVATSVKEAITTFEKRVDFVNVSFEIKSNDKGTRTAFMEVRYRIKATGAIDTNVLTVEEQGLEEQPCL